MDPADLDAKARALRARAKPQVAVLEPERRHALHLERRVMVAERTPAVARMGDQDVRLARLRHYAGLRAPTR